MAKSALINSVQGHVVMMAPVNKLKCAEFFQPLVQVVLTPYDASVAHTAIYPPLGVFGV